MYLKPIWDLSVNFRVPPERRASVSGEARRPRRGWGAGLAAGGELVHQAADGPRHRPSQTAPRPAGFRGRAKRPPPRLCAEIPLKLAAFQYNVSR